MEPCQKKFLTTLQRTSRQLFIWQCKAVKMIQKQICLTLRLHVCLPFSVMESSEVWSQPLQRRNFLPPLGPRLGPPVGMTSFSPPLRRPKTGHPKGQSPAAPGSPSKLAQPGQSPVNVKVARQLTQLGEDEAEVNEKVEAESEAEAEAEDGAKAEDDGKPREDLDKNSNHEDGGQKEAPPEKDGAKVASEQGSGGPSGSPVMDALAWSTGHKFK